MSSGAWETKCWGRTRCTVESDRYARHELELEAGGYCSFHYHAHRANRFAVVRGTVRVVEVYGWQSYARTLLPGTVHTVPSLVPHQFQVLEPGLMIEEYWADRGGLCLSTDIIRLTQGGRVAKILCVGLQLTDRSWTAGDIRQVTFAPSEEKFDGRAVNREPVVAVFDDKVAASLKDTVL